MHVFIFITILKMSFIQIICDTSSTRGVSDYMSVMLSVFSITYVLAMLILVIYTAQYAIRILDANSTF